MKRAGKAVGKGEVKAAGRLQRKVGKAVGKAGKAVEGRLRGRLRREGCGKG